MVCVTRTPYAMNIVIPVTMVTTCMAHEDEARPEDVKGLATLPFCATYLVLQGREHLNAENHSSAQQSVKLRLLHHNGCI